MKELDATYWSSRYKEGNTPWNIGYASPPLTAFFQNLQNKHQSILLPGAGNAYEAEWLWKNGFKNVLVADVAEEPLARLKKRVPEFPSGNLLHEDFFSLDLQLDLIIEQTFFCALEPERRMDYARQAQQLLKPGGKLAGVWFKFPLTEEGPPFGGSAEEYQRLFAPYFRIWKMEECYNSIKPRQGNELFLHLIKA